MIRDYTDFIEQPLALDPVAPSIHEIPEDFPDRWRFSKGEVTNLLVFVEGER